ncbi:MAG: heterodisulfide reductase-related iron-sulfur binding cluster, partial [Pseudomonadota bacterium]|nr:heterodisulfide reductase-related iron-sulfur binding cluster [Pseudomonadota bacterium]
YRAAEHRRGGTGFVAGQLSETDRNGKLAAPVAPLANWATRTGNGLTRPVMQGVLRIDSDAMLPNFHGKSFAAQALANMPEIDARAPAHGRKSVLYATCFVNYNNPGIGEAALKVLAKNGVETEIVYPGCCGMPKLEHGDIPRVADNAERIAAELVPWIDKGYDIVGLVPSCTLMLKFEWALLLPENQDVRRVAQASFDISEYIVDIARNEGLAPGMASLDGGVTVHLACHARAQNMGPKAADMLRLLPDTEIDVIERCSGHGGSWGMMTDNFETALKIGRPVARQANEKGWAHVASECPLAGLHILQGMEKLADAGSRDQLPTEAPHPIELMARAYGL